MSEEYTTEEVLDAIETCAHLRQVWGSGRYPNASFSPDVTKVLKLLRKLLKTKSGGNE